jgi:hypothetical protein
MHRYRVVYTGEDKKYPEEFALPEMSSSQYALMSFNSIEAIDKYGGLTFDFCGPKDKPGKWFLVEDKDEIPLKLIDGYITTHPPTLKMPGE